MKFVLSHPVLKGALDIVARFVSERETVPEGILITAESGQVTFMATDASKGATVELEAAVADPGQFCVRARTFVEMCRALPDSDTTFEVKGQFLALSNLDIRSRFEGLNVDHYPCIPAVHPQTEFSLLQSALRASIRRTLTCVAVDTARPVLNGICFDLREDRLTLVATDGNRLAVDVPTEQLEASGLPEITVPSAVAKEIFRVLSDDPDRMVTVRAELNSAEFTIGHVVIQSRLIDGRFPTYRKAVPEAFDRRITVSRNTLLAALKRCRILALQDKDVSDRILFTSIPGETAQDGKLSLWAQVDDVGEHQDELPATIEGEGLRFALRGYMLLEALEVAPGTEVTLQLNGVMDACVLRGEAESPYFTLLMPMEYPGMER